MVLPEKDTDIPTVMKERREQAGLSQEAVAARLGVSQGFYSKLERGLEEPKLIFLVRLAELYDGTVPEVFPSYVLTADEEEVVRHAQRLPLQKSA